MWSLSKRKVDYQINRFLAPSKITADDIGSRGVIGVIGPVGALEGAIMIAIGQPWYSEEWTLEEMLNFVEPQHRKSNHSRALIGYAKNIIDQVRDANTDLCIVIGVLSTKRTAAKIRLYSQMMQPVGAFFRYPALAHTTSEPLRRLYSKAS